jgi:hypothetical protein
VSICSVIVIAGGASIVGVLNLLTVDQHASKLTDLSAFHFLSPHLGSRLTPMCTPNPQQQPLLLQPSFVRVAGQYRVGKLLGSSGSGEPTLTRLKKKSELSRERLSRERYQDRG